MLLAFLVCGFAAAAAPSRAHSVRQLTEPLNHLEGPVWDARKGLLYYVQEYDGRINSYDHRTKEVRSIFLGGNVSVILPTSSDPNLFVVSNNKSLLVLRWDGKGEGFETWAMGSVQRDDPLVYFNDGKADVEGRLWIGTMGAIVPSGGFFLNRGALYSFADLHSPKVEISPVNVSNGMAWNANNTRYFYVDSLSQQVAGYDFDSETGRIDNPEVVFRVKDYPAELNPEAFPDGITIDVDDNLWIATYQQGSVLTVNPRTGKLLQVVQIPSPSVTSVAWGGPDYDILFVTTSRMALSEEERLKAPGAGSLYAVRNLGTRGLPTHNVDLGDVGFFN